MELPPNFHEQKKLYDEMFLLIKLDIPNYYAMGYCTALKVGSSWWAVRDKAVVIGNRKGAKEWDQGFADGEADAKVLEHR